MSAAAGPVFLARGRRRRRPERMATFSQAACADTPAVTQPIKAGNANASLATAPASGRRARRGRIRSKMYSAWIEALFVRPTAKATALGRAARGASRDPQRNLLFDHLGARRTRAPPPVVRPDCADLPYFLRAYFAWKRATALRARGVQSRQGAGFRRRATGSSRTRILIRARRAMGLPRSAASCAARSPTRRTPAPRGRPSTTRQATTTRCELSWETLRPGTTLRRSLRARYVLVIASACRRRRAAAALYAVDGQPDGTVARSFAAISSTRARRSSGGPGFNVSARRPQERLAESHEQCSHRGEPRVRRPLLREPGKLDTEGFYDAMDDVLARGRSIRSAMLQTIDALEEQVRTRSVRRERAQVAREGVAAWPRCRTAVHLRGR